MSYFDGENVDEKILDQVDLPPGKYHVRLLSTEKRRSKKDANTLLFANTFVVVSGAKAGERFMAPCVCAHANNDVVKLGLARMKQIALALTGMGSIQDPSDLLGKECLVEFANKKDGNGYRSQPVKFSEYVEGTQIETAEEKPF